jgi:hypothetical protein
LEEMGHGMVLLKEHLLTQNCSLFYFQNIFLLQQQQLEEDLLAEEFSDIWDKAPKFPDVEESAERIDVDSFVQVYRDIDDLFESEVSDEAVEETPKAAPPASEVKSVNNNAAEEDEDDEADESELVSIYETICDKNALISKDALQAWDEVGKLLEDGLLGDDEFEDLWAKTQKNTGSSEELDIDGFLSFNVALDGLFDFDDLEMIEDDDEEPLESSPKVNESEMVEGESLSTPALFAALANSNGLLGKSDLERWSELQEMLAEGDVLPLELESMFNGIAKSVKDASKLDESGFVILYQAISDLFDDIEMIDDEGPLECSPKVSELEMVEGESLSTPALFAALANSNGLLGEDDLERWSELQEMLDEGDVLPLELESMFNGIAKSVKDASKLDESGFVILYQAISDLFEEEIDEDVQPPKEEPEEKVPEQTGNQLKQELLDTIVVVSSDKDRLACGLECSEIEQRQVLSLITELEQRSTNTIRQKQGAVYDTDLAGTWELLYSSSSAMLYNKGLSGLGGSFPNGKFGGLTQKLQTSKYTTDVEYLERIDVTPSSASFDVKVTGDWDLRTSISIFTGEPSLVMTVEPDRVTYGPTSTRADHWKSLGPLNMLDVSYLDDDLRIMRGNTSIETVFVFRRTS